MKLIKNKRVTCKNIIKDIIFYNEKLKKNKRLELEKKILLLGEDENDCKDLFKNIEKLEERKKDYNEVANNLNILLKTQIDKEYMKLYNNLHVNKKELISVLKKSKTILEKEVVNLYIVDINNLRIELFNSNGKIIYILKTNSSFRKLFYKKIRKHLNENDKLKLKNINNLENWKLEEESIFTNLM